MLDAARPDRFSSYGYPRPTTPEIDRLAAEGVVFRRHYAQSTATRWSIPSMLYSRYFCSPIFPNSPHVPFSPPTALFRRPDDARISLPKALEKAGFKTAAISTHLWIGEDTPFAAEFTEAKELEPGPEESKYGYARADRAVDHAIQWITENREERFFLYIHLMDTHFPHFFEEDAQQFFGTDTYPALNFLGTGRPRDLTVPLTSDDRHYLDALYDGGLRYADRELGRLFDFLREHDILEETMIAITSDHGENLLEGPGDPTRVGLTALSHGGPWFERVARIPLIVFWPESLEPGDFTSFSEGVDLAPTLAALADVPLPPEKAFDGVNLVQVMEGNEPPKERVLSPRAIRTETHKCIFENGSYELLRDTAPDVRQLEGQLFDLGADPDERVDLFDSRPDLVRDMLDLHRRNLMLHFQSFVNARTSQQPASSFAIGSEHILTDEPVPLDGDRETTSGWSRFNVGNHTVLAVHDSDQPLSIEFRMPNGPYRMSLKIRGEAKIKVEGVEREVVEREDMVEFGDIEISDEKFRATLIPSRDASFELHYLGFVPPAAAHRAIEDEETLRRLKTLGYVQ